MEDGEKRAILDEIIELTAPPSIRPDEFTLYQYLDRLEERGLKKPARCTARNWLEGLVEEGKLEKRKVFLDGSWPIVYRRVEEGAG